MIRGALLIAACLSPFFFPLWFSIILTFSAAWFYPMTPLAVGILLDALFFTHGAFAIPLYTVLGCLGAALAFLVRRFVETSIMRA